MPSPNHIEPATVADTACPGALFWAGHDTSDNIYYVRYILPGPSRRRAPRPQRSCNAQPLRTLPSPVPDARHRQRPVARRPNVGPLAPWLAGPLSSKDPKQNAARAGGRLTHRKRTASIACSPRHVPEQAGIGLAAPGLGAPALSSGGAAANSRDAGPEGQVPGGNLVGSCCSRWDYCAAGTRSRAQICRTDPLTPLAGRRTPFTGRAMRRASQPSERGRTKPERRNRRRIMQSIARKGFTGSAVFGPEKPASSQESGRFCGGLADHGSPAELGGSHGRANGRLRLLLTPPVMF